VRISTRKLPHQRLTERAADTRVDALSSSKYASQPAASSMGGPKAQNHEVEVLLLGEHPAIFTPLAHV
jgi:hypothetical protein